MALEHPLSSAAADSPTHPFDQALTLMPLEHPAEQPAARRWQGRVHPAYQNMVGPFGGLTAAQALNAVLQHPDRLGEPVALTVNFAAALLDQAFQVEACPVRTNRSTQHWTVALTQTDASGARAVMVTATAVTATRRSTWSATDATRPDAPAPESLPRARAERQPVWFDRYDLRVCSGGLPSQWDSSEAESLTAQWVRDDPARPLDYCSVAALSDVFFPRVWRRRALPTPAGTVSMTVYFHVGAAELTATGSDYIFGQARGQRYFNGYFDQRAELWSRAGALLATSHQIVYFKE